jgi:hypothetical protein
MSENLTVVPLALTRTMEVFADSWMAEQLEIPCISSLANSVDWMVQQTIGLCTSVVQQIPQKQFYHSTQF